jgi:CDGSH-type Zn-finger protein
MVMVKPRTNGKTILDKQREVEELINRPTYDSRFVVFLTGFSQSKEFCHRTHSSGGDDDNEDLCASVSVLGMAKKNREKKEREKEVNGERQMKRNKTLRGGGESTGVR